MIKRLAIALAAGGAAVFWAATGPYGNPDCMIISHRANAPGLPENSLAGIRRNIELDPGGVEVDVTMTKGGGMILMHDATLDRTTTCAGPATDYSAKEIASSCRLSNGEGVPLLRDALRPLLRDYGGLVFLDVKYSGDSDELRERHVDLLSELLREFAGERRRVIVSSFDFRLLNMFLKKGAGIRIACEGSYRWSILRGTENLLSIRGQSPGSLRLRLGDFFGVPAYLYTVARPSDLSATVLSLARHSSVKGIMVDDVATSAALLEERIRRPKRAARACAGPALCRFRSPAS